MEAWGEFFQSLCRISCEDSTRSDPGEGELITGDHEDCNTLQVCFPRDADTRLVLMFWSALAFSSGYDFFKTTDYQERHRDREILQACYTALAFISPFNGVKRYRWMQQEVQDHAIGAMLEIRTASLEENGALAGVLSTWYCECKSLLGGGNAVEVAALNHTILLQYGFVLHDIGAGDWLEVYVPGYGPCRVSRSDWEWLNIPSRDNLRQLASQPQLERLCLEPRDLDASTWKNLGSVFHVLGASLIKVDIKKTGYGTNMTRLRPEGLLSILASCPALLHLTVNGFKPPKHFIEIDTNRIVARRLQRLCIDIESELDKTRTRIKLNRSPAFDAFFADLFSHIGLSLEHLEIRKRDGIMPFAQAFYNLMVSAPRLNYVALCGMDIQSVKPVSDAYSEARTQRTTLDLENCYATSMSFGDFIDSLGEPSYSTHTVQLHTLAIRFTRDPRPFSRILQQCISMLEGNQTLRDLLVGIPATMTDRIAHIAPRVSHLRSCSGQWLSCQRAPLALPTKYAFLSVVVAKNLPIAADSSRLVFAFAAERARRQCSVQFY